MAAKGHDYDHSITCQQCQSIFQIKDRETETEKVRGRVMFQRFVSNKKL